MSKKRRIQAPEPLASQFNGQSAMAKLLLDREVGIRSNAYTNRGLTEAALQRVRLQRSFDVHDTLSTAGMALPYMQRRSPVLEVLVHDQLLFVLVNSGLCSVFDIGVTPERRLSYLNAGEHDIIRSILFNPHDASILAVSCHSTDDSFPSQLHCRSVPANKGSFTLGALYCNASKPICDTVAHPGFVEFDDSATRALVFNSTTMQYKIYDLSHPNYTLLYTIPASSITEVKLSATHLLLVRQPCSSNQQQTHHSASAKQTTSCYQQPAVTHSQVTVLDTNPHGSGGGIGQQLVPIEVMSAVNGQILARHELPVQCSQAYFEVLELFDHHLLLKQPMQPLKIIDALTFAVTGSSSHESLSQVSSFVFLQQQHLFLTISYHTLTTWNFRRQILGYFVNNAPLQAEPVASFEDHSLWYPGNLDDPLMYLTGDWVVSYCRPKNMQTSLLAANAVGAIHISNVWTGKLIAKLEAKQSAEEAADMGEFLLNLDCSAAVLASEQATRRALTDVTCVLYDEASNTIYTGNQAGMVHHWGPGSA